MSAEDIRRLGELYDRFNREGPSALGAIVEEFWDPEIVYQEDPRWPGARTYRGRDAVAEAFFADVAALGIVRVALEEVVERGEDIAWVLHTWGRSEHGDVPNEHRWGYVGRFKDGKVVFFQAHYDPAGAVGPPSRR